MAQLLEEEGMSMTPFSPLAAGRVCRLWGSESARAQMDKVAQIKYDQEKEIDYPIVERINETFKSFVHLSTTFLLYNLCTYLSSVLQKYFHILYFVPSKLFNLLM